MHDRNKGVQSIIDAWKKDDNGSLWTVGYFNYKTGKITHKKEVHVNHGGDWYYISEWYRPIFCKCGEYVGYTVDGEFREVTE